MRRALPSGTVTLLFTDVEGSTRLLHQLGADAYAEALAEHRRVIRETCDRDGGVEVDTQGDAFFFAFPTAPGALSAASALTEALAAGPVQVRVGLHTGTPLLTEEGYVGDDVHRAARIAAAGHGGQVLVSASTAALVELELRDLGEHRFKDLSAPERVYQLGAAQFPPLKTLHQTNLPIPQTPFLGREKELGEVLALLGRDDIRLLTLTGPGGTGKTRLATQAAGALAERYSDGVWWVPLAPLRDPELVLESAGQALGARDGLASHIADKRMLLLFDNFEQVVAAAHGLSALLGTCPNLELLVTSREPLHLAGEQEYSVPPLVAEEGVGFFAARARAARPGFEIDEAVPAICRRLDSLPLALELAASRVKALSTDQILARLDQRLPLLTGGARDAPERQRTLRATIEWSYDLLSESEQVLFQLLSVFVGGCTLEAAEEVCDADLDILQLLVEKSLVRFTGERYWMLETIREYAAEQLEQRDDAAAWQLRQAEWCCELAEGEGGMPPYRHLDEGVGSLPDEYDNVRAAIAATWASGRNELALRFGPACLRFWMSRGLFSEASSWLERAEPLIESVAPRVGLEALRAAGVIAFWVLADTDRAEELWTRAHVRAEDLGESEAVTWIERMRAGVAWERGDLEQALSLYEQNLSEARASGNRQREAECLHTVGEVLRDLERFEEGEEMLLSSTAIYRELGLPRFVTGNLHSLADLALDRGDLVKAEHLYRDVLELYALHSGLHGPRDVAYCFAGLASVFAERGLDDVAATLWGAVCAAEETLGFHMISFERRRYESRLGRVENTTAWVAGRRMTLEEAQAVLDTTSTDTYSAKPRRDA